MPALRLRSEPLRQQFEAAPTKRLLFSLFPLTVWTEELRLDLVSTGFALFFLMAQYVNIYHFNLLNYNVEVLLLGALVLSKRCLAAMGSAVFQELGVRAPVVAKLFGAAAPSAHAKTAMGGRSGLATTIKAALLGPVLIIATALLLNRMSNSSSAGPLQAFGYVFVVLFDFLLLFVTSSPLPFPSPPSRGSSRGAALAAGAGRSADASDEARHGGRAGRGSDGRWQRRGGPLRRVTTRTHPSFSRLRVPR